MNTRATLHNAVIVQAPQPGLRATPGQFFLAIPPTFDPFLPRPAYPFRLRDDFVESLIVSREVGGWVQRGGLVLRGAYGKGFSLASTPSRALVLAADAAAGALLVPLLDSLVRREAEVAMLCGPDPMKESWLPPEVEYHIVEDLLASASPLWGWADGVFACGPIDFYDLLLADIKNTRLHLDNGWAQILVQLPMPCGIGLCYACAFKTRGGVMLNCRDGPVFDLADWVSGG